LKYLPWEPRRQKLAILMRREIEVAIDGTAVELQVKQMRLLGRGGFLQLFYQDLLFNGCLKE
jgi:hypothetical protein